MVPAACQVSQHNENFDPTIDPNRLVLGQVYSTPRALARVGNAEIAQALDRHSRADWGDLSEQDILANDEAMKQGGRLLSAYVAAHGIRFWIITEADRSTTTILLPDEY